MTFGATRNLPWLSLSHQFCSWLLSNHKLEPKSTGYLSRPWQWH